MPFKYQSFQVNLTATGVFLSVAFWIENKIVDGNNHVFTLSEDFQSVKGFDKVDQCNVLADKQVDCIINSQW